MTIFLFFLLAAAVIGRPNEESINDLERIVYLDGSGKSISRSTNTGKTNDLNNYSDARRKADTPTSSVKPIEKSPADTYPIATADEIDSNEEYAVARFNSPASYRRDSASGLGGPKRVHADRISNIEKKIHRNLNDVRSLKNNLNTIFTGIDTFGQGKLPKKTSLDDSASVVREGLNQDALNNSVSVIELDNVNKSATDMLPEETEGLDMVQRYQIPLPESISASHCHCGTINGRRTCTCAHQHDSICEDICARLELMENVGHYTNHFTTIYKPPVANFAHVASIYKSVNGPPPVDDFDNLATIFKGVNGQPPAGDFDNLATLYKGVNGQPPAGDFDNLATIHKGVNGQPLAGDFDNLATIHKGLNGQPPVSDFDNLVTIFKGVNGRPPAGDFDNLATIYKGVNGQPTVSDFDNLVTIFKGVNGQPPAGDFDNSATVYKGVNGQPTVSDYDNLVTIFKGVNGKPPAGDFDNSATIYKGVNGPPPVDDFDNLATIFKGVNGQPPVIDFDTLVTIFKGVNGQPPSGDFDNSATIYKGINRQPPVIDFDTLVTIFKGVNEQPPAGDFDNSATIYKGVNGQPTVSDFDNLVTIFKGVNGQPLAGDFDNSATIYKGVNRQPPVSDFDNLVTIYKGVNGQPPAGNFAHVATLFKGVNEQPPVGYFNPPTSNFDSIFQAVAEKPRAIYYTTPTPTKSYTIQNYPSNKLNCNCRCGCCSCACKSYTQNFDNEDMENVENFGSFEDPVVYVLGDIKGLQQEHIRDKFQSLGWNGMFEASGGLVPYVPGSPGSNIGAYSSRFDTNSAQESNDMLSVGSESRYPGFGPLKLDSIMKSSFGHDGGSGSSGHVYSSGSYKDQIAKLFANVQNTEKVFTKHVPQVSDI